MAVGREGKGIDFEFWVTDSIDGINIIFTTCYILIKQDAERLSQMAAAMPKEKVK